MKKKDWHKREPFQKIREGVVGLNLGLAHVSQPTGRWGKSSVVGFDKSESDAFQSGRKKAVTKGTQILKSPRPEPRGAAPAKSERPEPRRTVIGSKVLVSPRPKPRGK